MSTRWWLQWGWNAKNNWKWLPALVTENNTSGEDSSCGWRQTRENCRATQSQLCSGQRHNHCFAWVSATQSLLCSGHSLLEHWRACPLWWRWRMAANPAWPTAGVWSQESADPDWLGWCMTEHKSLLFEAIHPKAASGEGWMKLHIDMPRWCCSVFPWAMTEVAMQHCWSHSKLHWRKGGWSYEACWLKPFLEEHQEEQSLNVGLVKVIRMVRFALTHCP